jgi:hypothetical protein
VAPPSESSTRRFGELRQLARRFAAHEMWDNDGATGLQRYELRLLPRPIHRYTDAQQGVDEGGLFVFSYGGNPEILMVLEARHDAEGRAQWQCGFARMSWAAGQVSFDGQEIWKQEKIRGPASNYVLRAVPTPPE